MAYTSFMRGDNTKMTNTPYTDGLIFLNTEEQALYLDDNNERIPMGGAGTGGHIIENNAGTDMTERTNLQFGGVYVSDDETNDRTKVNVTRNMSKDDFDQLTTAEKLGVIVTSNDPNDYVPFSADMVEYDNTNSGMTATDVQDAIDELNSDITIDLSDTSLSPSTDFNSLIQMMAEKLYPARFYLIRNGAYENNCSYVSTQQTIARNIVSDYSHFYGSISGYCACRFIFDGNLSDYTTLVIEGYTDNTDGDVKMGLCSTLNPTQDTVSPSVELSLTLNTQRLSIGTSACVAFGTTSSRGYYIKNMYLE